MRKAEVRDPAQALVYITDCTLATVCDLATKKKKSKSEFARQISIAQTSRHQQLPGHGHRLYKGHGRSTLVRACHPITSKSVVNW